MKAENVEQSAQIEKDGETESFKSEGYFSEPRKEYREGILPLQFEHKFNDGKRLIAKEENGIATIVLKNDNEIIFNFSDLLPKGYKFVTPISAKKTGNENLEQSLKGSIWSANADDKFVLIGDWRDPRELITLFHEIGHANEITGKTMEKRKNIFKKFDAANLEVANLAKAGLEIPFNIQVTDNRYITAYKNQVELARKVVSEISKQERNAWAYALNKFRKIQKEKNVDLKSIFPDLASLKAFIYPCLKSYKSHYEAEGKGLEILSYGMPEVYKEAEKFQKELLDYFDKQKDFDRPSKSV